MTLDISKLKAQLKFRGMLGEVIELYTSFLLDQDYVDLDVLGDSSSASVIDQFMNTSQFKNYLNKHKNDLHLPLKGSGRLDVSCDSKA